jgi:hypothetical protein
MAGEVTYDLVQSGVFPMCLSESFAAARKGQEEDYIPAGEWSPWAHYIYKKQLSSSAGFWLLLAFICSTVGFTILTLNGAQSKSSVMLGLAAVFSFFCALNLFRSFGGGPSGCKGDLAGFESRLEEVLNVFKVSGAPRPVHLMSLVEVRQWAHEILVRFAGNVLDLEKRIGTGDKDTEKMRNELKRAYDLFIFYGLIEKTEEGYKPFYEAAAQQLASSSSK